METCKDRVHSQVHGLTVITWKKFFLTSSLTCSCFKYRVVSLILLPDTTVQLGYWAVPRSSLKQDLSLCWESLRVPQRPGGKRSVEQPWEDKDLVSLLTT